MKHSKKKHETADISNYEKQRNYLVNLNYQYKNDHFDSLNPEKSFKTFWKSCKPYFSNKHFLENQILH